jgi:hypothetical protein
MKLADISIKMIGNERKFSQKSCQIMARKPAAEQPLMNAD